MPRTLEKERSVDSGVLEQSISKHGILRVSGGGSRRRSLAAAQVEVVVVADFHYFQCDLQIFKHISNSRRINETCCYITSLIAPAARKSFLSVPHWPTKEIPNGQPSSPFLVGKLIAGRPANDAGTVNIS